MIVPIAILLALLVLAAIAIVTRVRVSNRGRVEHPTCGACGYNLTGCPSTRCPECGRLLIEAGVLTPQLQSEKRRWLAPLLIGLLGFLLLLAAIGTAQYFMIRAERAVALAARAQAMAAQLQAQSIAAQQKSARAAASQPTSSAEVRPPDGD